MKSTLFTLILTVSSLGALTLLSGCGGFKTTDGLSSFQSKATAYYPSNEGIEGGYFDRKGKPLYTVQQYVRGEAPYISVAMDSTIFPYGTRIRIPELEEVFGRNLEFRVVDTGGAFRGKGTTKIDICVENKSEAYKKHYNGYVTIIVL